MKENYSRIWSETYSNREWAAMKWMFIVFWNIIVLFLYSTLTPMRNQMGVCVLLDCNVLLTTLVKGMIFSGMMLFTLLYLMERAMLVATAGLCLISILVLSAGESNGIAARSEILSAVLLAQVMAYAKYFIAKDDEAIRQDRVRYSVQIIVAAYSLAALSKLMTSGVKWIFDNEQLAINVKVTILRFNADFGIDGLKPFSDFMHGLFLHHPSIMASILMASIVVESIAFMALFGKRWSMMYGFILIIFHVSIFLTMFVFVPPFLLCVFVFLLNGPILVVTVVRAMVIWCRKSYERVAAS